MFHPDVVFVLWLLDDVSRSLNPWHAVCGWRVRAMYCSLLLWSSVVVSGVESHHGVLWIVVRVFFFLCVCVN